VPFLEPLTDKSLADRAYETIRDAILTMSLKPGEALVEARLANALGISKTPIRQALHRLEQTGLVVGLANRGYFVSSLTQRDASEIMEIRAVLEGLAARRACERLSDTELSELESLLDQARRAYESGQAELCAELGHQFHQALLVKADNQRLSLMIGILSDQFHRIRLLSSHIPGRLPHSVEEHAQLLDALRSRDVELAETRMREHLIAVYQEIERDESLSTDGSPSSGSDVARTNRLASEIDS
jgi:DNA-binding GntR family transcriptional regulator